MEAKTKTMQKIKRNFRWDTHVFFIVLLVFLLTGLGCVFVYSASSYASELRYGNSTVYLTKQIIGVILGFCALVFFSFFPYEKLKKLKGWLVLICIVLLLAVFLPGIGVEKYGASRWINLGFTTLQPSELAKFTLVIFSAAYLSDRYEQVKKFKTLLPVLGVGLAFCLLVIVEPNMSVTMCIGMIMLFMLFIGGARLKHFGMLAMPAAAVVPVLIFMEPYRIKRLMAFINPWASPQGEGFQLIQSLYSLGSGGLFGVGIGNSRQKYLFLPFSESDFIFSIIGEETGWFGCIFIMLLFAALIGFLFFVGRKAKDRFGFLLCCGIGAVIGIQALMNIAVVTGSIPPTGIPLPFISAGSTSLMVFMGAVGIAINVWRRRRETPN